MLLYKAEIFYWGKVSNRIIYSHCGREDYDKIEKSIKSQKEFIEFNEGSIESFVIDCSLNYLALFLF